MKNSIAIFLVIIVALSAVTALAEDYDISPFLQNGQLIVGGLAHTGDREGPPITVFGYDFAEDPYDPFNPSDPGVMQDAGVGNLTDGDPVGYNILSSLLYWNGNGSVSFAAPPGQTYMTMLVGATTTLTGTSGAQPGSLIEVVGAGGFMHKHFTTSLYAAPGAGNVPDVGDPTFIAPAAGIYAFGMDLTLTDGGTDYVSTPFWIVWNNELSDDQAAAAMNAVSVLSVMPHPGDANNDGAVNVTDLGILAKNYGVTSGATWAMADFNGDGAVDVTDLGILAKNYDWVGVPTAVPEPATMVLLALGGLAMVRRRNHKRSAEVPI